MSRRNQKKYYIGGGIVILAFALWMFGGISIDVGDSNQASSSRSEMRLSDRFSDLFGRDASRRRNKDVSESNRKQPKLLGIGDARFVTISAPLDHGKTKALLEKKDYDPELLSSALLLCNDPEVKNKAKEAAQNHGVVAAVLSMSEEAPQCRLEYASLLIKNEPGNILGYLVSAETLFQMGDKEKAWTFIGQSKALENLDTFNSQLSDGQNRMFEESGYDVVERGLLAGKNEWNEKILNLLGGLSDHVLVGAEGNDAAERASWLLNTIDQFKAGMKDEMPMAQASRLDNLEALALRTLPEGFQMVDGGTAEDRANQIAFRRTEVISKKRAIAEELDKSAYNIAEQYYQRVLAQGEEAASVWLLGK